MFCHKSSSVLAAALFLVSFAAAQNAKLGAEEALSAARTYEEGTTVPKDLKRASELYRKAADKGSPEAQVRLGRLLSSDEVGKPDAKAACFWTRLAALGAEKYRRDFDDLDTRIHCSPDDAKHRIADWLGSHEERFDVPGFLWLSQDESKKYELQKAIPRYPQSARQSRVQGTVVFRALVNSDGTMRQLALLIGDEPFVSATLAAIQTWQFKPYLVNGSPTPFVTTIKTEFTLR